MLLDVVKSISTSVMITENIVSEGYFPKLMHTFGHFYCLWRGTFGNKIPKFPFLTRIGRILDQEARTIYAI